MRISRRLARVSHATRQQASTRYQVLSWGPYGDQLDTWYRVEPFKCLNSIPSIELLLLLGATRYLASSWEQCIRIKLINVPTIRVRVTQSQIFHASSTPFAALLLLVLWCSAMLLSILCACSCSVAARALVVVVVVPCRGRGRALCVLCCCHVSLTAFTLLSRSHALSHSVSL